MRNEGEKGNGKLRWRGRKLLREINYFSYDGCSFEEKCIKKKITSRSERK